MNLFGLLDPRVNRLTANGIRSYLLQNGWRLIPDPRGKALIFSRDDEQATGEFVRMLPMSEHFKEYVVRLVELLSAVGEHEGRPPLDIVSDILRLQESPQSTNGNTTKKTARSSKSSE